MKKICTLLALLASLQLSAQHNYKGSPFVLKHCTPTANSTANKTTATASRLIAAAGEEYVIDSADFVYTDSAFVTYFGERGGDMNSEYIKFDNGTLWYNMGNGLEEAEKMTQAFDGNDNILSTLIQEWDGSAWINSYGTVLTYDGNNNIISETEIEWNQGTNSWDSLQRYLYMYNGNNILLEETGAQWNGSNWENTYRHAYILDLSDNITLWAYLSWNTGTSVWDTSGKIHYTYNSDNLVTEWWDESWQTNTWQKHNKHVVTYDQNDKPLTTTRHSWDGSNWVIARVITNTWQNDNLVNILVQYANGDNETNQDNTFDSGHNMLSSTNQHWFNGAWVNDGRIEWTYNSYSQMLTDKMLSWVNNAWGHDNGDLTNRYYYETYTTGIENSKLSNEHFRLYPVPAHNHIKVEMTWKEAQPFAVSILDMQGRLIRHYSEKPATNYSRNMDVSQLPAGNYFIKVAGTKSKASYRQFTVTH